MTNPKKFTHQQIYGAILVAFAFSITLFITFLGDNAPKTISLPLALVSGLFQIASAWIFNGQGRAHPTLAGASVRRLIRLASRANTGKITAETLFEGHPTKDQQHVGLGLLSVQLSHIEEDAVDAIEDWRAFHSAAVKEVTKESDGITN